MATLAETLINDAADLGKINVMYQDSPFVKELPVVVQKVASAYMQKDVPLNQSIAKIAKSHDYTDDQLQRICEESNNQVYMAKYAAYKGSPERDVSFELASVRRVKEIRDGKLEKKASFLNADMGIDHLDKYAFSVSPEEEVSLHKITAQKATSALTKLETEQHKYANSATEDMNCIAQVLIEQEKLGNDADAIFGHLCKTASFSEPMMDLCKQAVEDNLQRMRKQNYVPSTFSLTLNKFQEKSAFSLGEYSFAKEASAPKFSSMVTENGTAVKSIYDAEKIANRFCTVFEKLASVQKVLSGAKRAFGLKAE